MSVMLIRPNTPYSSHSGLVSVQYPINIGYLSAFLKHNSVNCYVRDFEVEKFNEDEFKGCIKATSPKLIGFSCMTPHILNAAYLASIVKNNFPEIKTVAGGAHPSAIPEQTLREFPQFDLVVVGEGENTLLELAQRLICSKGINDVAGIAFNDKGKINLSPPRMPIEDLDKIPFPDRSFLPMRMYKKSHVSKGFSRSFLRVAEVTISRGCPYQCIFCASKVVHSCKIRFRSIENITKEIEKLVDDFKIEHISFLDDTITIRKDILSAVCGYLRMKKITFDCFTRVDHVDDDTIKLMAGSGCKKISFGIESGSQKILRLIKKGTTVSQAREAFRLCRKHKIAKIEGSFMIGSHPDEDREDIELTRKLIFEVCPDILAIFIVVPYPGTELNRMLKERKFLNNENWQDFKLFLGNPSWKCCQVPNEELKEISKSIINKHYLNPALLIKNFAGLRSIEELFYWLRLAFSYVKTCKL